MSAAARSRKAAAAARPATRLRSLGRALQLGGEILVSSERSLRAVPRSAIRIRLRIGRLGQRTVNRLPVGQRRGAIDRRAHERMMKPDLRGEFDQANRLRRRGRFDAQPDQLRRAHQQRRVTRWLGRGEKQEPLGLVGHRPDPSEEALLEASGERLRRAHSEAARELGRRQSARELEQRQRVAARLGDDPLDHPLIDAAGDRQAEHPARVFVIQAPQDELGQSGEVCSSAGSRTANTRATDSAMSRRATNASVRAEA